MTRKKAKPAQEPVVEQVNSTLNGDPVHETNQTKKSHRVTSAQPITPPPLVICRNKHWRYISSYHGPWLNLPPEILESLAYSNFYSPRPQPIDPAVFFDIVKTRTLIEDATSLAVRAANGTTSASLTASLSAGNGMLNGSDAQMLGLGTNRGGANAKLSKERKHRMREQATQKLSRAYHLDEIAASVATMQAASALEEVANHVLQRNEHDPDAEYVHFFHEKIPSRAMAEHTTLETLDDIIRQRPTEAAPLRTRAVTRIFKDDLLGATRDLTEALHVYKLYHAPRSNEQRELILLKDAIKMTREDAKLDEKDHPSSLEPQLLFHRAGAYLTLACDNIEMALEGQSSNGSFATEPTVHDAPPQSQIQARKLVRTYAKRALRDYMSFLSHFDYTPGLRVEYTEAFLQKVNAIAQDAGRSRSEKLLNLGSRSDQGLSDALVKYEKRRDCHEAMPQIPKPLVYKLNELFAAVQPPGLPSYPPDHYSCASETTNEFCLPEFSEAVTYHPLLTDVLHSLLLSHCLIQTSEKELLRHAHMAARIARVCDGYPIFLAARSPARADWIEVLRRKRNWLGLQDTWEALCSPAPLAGSKKNRTAEGPNEQRHKISNGADMHNDERVVDESAIRASVHARELKAARDEEEEQRKEYHRTSPHRASNGHHQPKRWAQEGGREYPITTERAEMIAYWISEAPPPSASSEGKSRKGIGKKTRLRKQTSNMSADSPLDGVNGLEQSVESLDLLD